MKRVLAVDDDIAILECLHFVLQEQGYNVLSVSDAGCVTEKVKKFKPDLVLLDIKLSGMSGSEIANTIKHTAKTSHIPVVLISANYDGLKISQKIGADGFLEKPFDSETLSRTVKKYIH